MKKKLFEAIAKEDPKNPYTDQELAQLLKVNREEICNARKEYSIPDSRERRKGIVTDAILSITRSQDLSQRQLVDKLNKLGFKISRSAVASILNEINLTTKNESAPLASKSQDVFESLIGYEDSLKSSILQAKAAMMYPPKGLNTLIIGPTGVGKSQLAELMFKFAQNIHRMEDGKFIVFNCADYAENPQLLISQLFGHVKGAFTGASEDKKGIINKADGGILFLDEVHRLPPEGQEILFNVMDRGKYRRLGESNFEQKANTLIIAATTEDPDSNLLLTFRRRIPMLISLPALNERSLKERYEFIRDFTESESRRINKPIKILSEVLWALMLYECPGNVGQLKSDIQVACAKAFLTHVIESKKQLTISLADVPTHISRGLLKLHNNRKEIDKLVKGSLTVVPTKRDDNLDIKDDMYIMPNQIYQYIQKRYKNLYSSDVSTEIINKIIGEEVEGIISNLVKNYDYQRNNEDTSQIQNIVGDEVFEMIESIIEISEKGMKVPFDKSLISCLALHLSSAFERIEQGKKIYNPQLDKIKNEYIEEFMIATKMAQYIQENHNISLPESEIGFLALYLVMSNKKSKKHSNVGILVMSHGNVASNMLQTACDLLHIEHGIAIDMQLTEIPDQVLEQAIKRVREIDEGKGVLILVDMGSLLSFGEIITERTGIKTKTLVRVDTLLVMEAVRKAVLPGETLDGIYDSFSKSNKSIISKNKFTTKRPQAIIIACITGKGVAEKIKNTITTKLPGIDDVCKIKTVGFRNEEGEMEEVVNEVSKMYQIKAVVGTFNPVGNENVPFITVDSIYKGEGLKQLKSTIEGCPYSSPSHQLNLKQLFDSKLVFKNYKSEEMNYRQILKHLSDMLIKRGYVKDSFYEDVLEREKLGGTIINSTVAIPHSEPTSVIKPAIVTCFLEKPVKWGADYIEVIFLMAINEYCFSAMGDLIKIIDNPTLLAEMKCSTLDNFWGVVDNVGK